MALSPTAQALFTRGIDSGRATTLARQGFTMNKLKQLSLSQLNKLGVEGELAKEIRKGTRPPIPTETLHRLLYESQSTCCRCRKPHKPIIIHHITAWSETRDHSEQNLIVLCLHCHSDAHTKRDLALNVTSDQLRHDKARWLSEVKDQTLNLRLSPPAHSIGFALWDFFNHRRILDVAATANFPIENGNHFESLRLAQVISEDGELPVPKMSYRGREYNYVYESIELGRHAYSFYESVLRGSLTAFPVVDLSESWSRSSAKLLHPGSIVIYAGGWRFKKKFPNKAASGRGQTRTAYVQKRGILLTFDFDAWETTSCSSWGHLSGSWSCTAVCVVRSIEQVAKSLVINATGLAIGTGFTLPDRDTIFSGYFVDPEGDED